jgi:hypothetical protein
MAFAQVENSCRWRKLVDRDGWTRLCCLGCQGCFSQRPDALSRCNSAIAPARHLTVRQIPTLLALTGVDALSPYAAAHTKLNVRTPKLGDERAAVCISCRRRDDRKLQHDETLTLA